MPTTDWAAFDPRDRSASSDPPSASEDAQDRIAWALSSLAARLEASEENFRTFFETVDDIIIVGSLDGRIVYANPALKRKLGFSTADVRSMDLLALHPPELRAEAGAIYAEMWSGTRDACPLPLRTKSGALVPVETRVWFGTWNEQDCIFGISRDLSAEQEALQKFDRLFRHNPCPMAVSTVPDGAFTDVNDAWLALLGYARSEVVGRTSRELDLFVDDAAQRRAGRRLEVTGRTVDAELQVRRKDGSILDGVFAGEIIESQGVRHFLTVMVDRTEARQAREALVREARRRAAVGRAIGSTADELDELLGAITVAVARLDADLPPDDPRRDTLAGIEDAARRSAGATRRLVALSRDEADGPVA